MMLFFSLATRMTSPGSSLDTPTNTSQFAAASKPSIVQDQFKWTAFMSKVNLPAVLNDPRLSRRETDFFTKTWGEGFESGNILPAPQLPEIRIDHFRKYLKKISAVSMHLS